MSFARIGEENNIHTMVFSIFNLPVETVGKDPIVFVLASDGSSTYT